MTDPQINCLIAFSLGFLISKLFFPNTVTNISIAGSSDARDNEKDEVAAIPSTTTKRKRREWPPDIPSGRPARTRDYTSTSDGGFVPHYYISGNCEPDGHRQVDI
jgi:hypothetical protein